MTSAVTTGLTVHRRFVEVERSFRYRVFHVLVDVDELDALARDVAGFGPARPLAVRARDHFGDGDQPLRAKVERWVTGQGAQLGDGALLVWTYPAILGHVFNPVSWWFSYDRSGTLVLAIAEVNNTFGDWHAYLVRPGTAGDDPLQARVDKVFHVSPFLPVDGLTYDFTITPPRLDDPSRPVAASIKVTDADGARVFDAVQQGSPQPLTTSSLWRAVLRHPLVSLVTLGRIHWQALKLFLRGATFHRRPEPPATGLADMPAHRGDSGSEHPLPSKTG